MITNAALLRSLQALHLKVDILMSQQDEVNADVTTIEAGIEALNAAATNIAAEIAALQAANPALDLSALDAHAAALTAAVGSITALAPPAP